MKNLYVCEKCGKTFTDWDEAYKCEHSHATLDQVYSWDMPQGSCIQTEFYSEGEITPEYIVMKANSLDENGDCVTTHMPNGRDILRYHAVVYKRVDKVKLPNGMTPEDYTAAILARQTDDNSEEDEG